MSRRQKQATWEGLRAPSPGGSFRRFGCRPRRPWPNPGTFPASAARTGNMSRSCATAGTAKLSPSSWIAHLWVPMLARWRQAHLREQAPNSAARPASGHGSLTCSVPGPVVQVQAFAGTRRYEYPHKPALQQEHTRGRNRNRNATPANLCQRWEVSPCVSPLAAQLGRSRSARELARNGRADFTRLRKVHRQPVGGDRAARDVRYLYRPAHGRGIRRTQPKNPRSSALGPFQFIKSTFLELTRRHFPQRLPG